MKKTIKLIDLDCGHCADKIQNAVQKIDGVTSVSVNFLGQKMVLEAPDDRFDAILNEAKALIKKIEPDGQVDIPLAGYAPHRTGRAAFPHPALYKTDSSTAVLHIHLHRFSVLPMDTPLAFR